jgi:type III restriction enzyme
MLTLKHYQQTALDMLREYLALARTSDAKKAFIYLTERPYHSVPQLPGLPYVCVRIPTGGGKTLMACHAVSLAAREFLAQDRCVVLWLTPTNTIKEQTLAALNDLRHPYRQTLDSALDNVAVMDLAAALSVSRPALDGGTVVVVSTLAALRVEDTDGRKVYDENGALMAHFENLPGELSARLDQYEDGRPIPSFANVLHLRRPVVIVDEAHNARTPLSFDTLARLNPACILEFTATPVQPPDPSPSNVLYQVSAYELKAEAMIKLPVRLETRQDWKEALAAAVSQRAGLEELARAEREAGGEYLRPLALIQAQPRRSHGESINVDAVKAGLKELSVAEEQIAVETGEVSEVKQWEEAHKRKLADETCPIRFIITVQKLREGWDCPFAYVLCSVAEMGAQTAVEQILGRVLRMPNAARKQNDALNHAYAFVTSQRFTQAAQAAHGLTEALIANGFSRFEAQDSVHVQAPLPGDLGPLFAPVQAPARQTPAEREESLSVPQLAFWAEDELLPVPEGRELEFEWQLSKYDPGLSEEEFPAKSPTEQVFEVDVTKEGQILPRFVRELHGQLGLLNVGYTPTLEELVMWLDRRIPNRRDIVQAESHAFLMKMLARLIDGRGLTLEQLSRERYRLLAAAAQKIKAHRDKAARAAYQQTLFGSAPATLEVSARRVFTYHKDLYPANELYEGAAFSKHYYRAVGKLNGEEALCAQRIDSLPRVKFWVRNLERQPDFSFWLPTPTDKFYPDFVALLDDGKVLAVEYKGELSKESDNREKIAVGNLWAERSGGQCLFLFVTKDDFESKLQAAAG